MISVDVCICQTVSHTTFQGFEEKKMSVLTDYSHNLISEDITLNDEKSSLSMNIDHN